MVSQASTYHGKILILLQHKRLVTCDEMCVVRTEVVKETFDPEAELGSNFVFYPPPTTNPVSLFPPLKLNGPSSAETTTKLLSVSMKAIPPVP